jgi:hypothetical protein
MAEIGSGRGASKFGENAHPGLPRDIRKPATAVVADPGAITLVREVGEDKGVRFARRRADELE